jgi:hypothetical protein
MTARVLPRWEIELYQTNLGVDFQTVPCDTEDEVITATWDKY